MRRIFEQGKETAAIADFFKQLPVGKEVSYGELEQAVGRYKTASYQSAVKAARRDGVVISTIRSYGFVRLEAEEIVGRQDRHLRSIRRKATVIQSEVATAVRGNLTQASQLRATTIHAAAGVIRSSANVPRSNEERPAPPVFVTPRTAPR